jgi:predicted  nucleic acid-binding Zn-ribbon protein
VHFGKYLAAAFLNHWNLLLFLGGMGFSLLSGRADMLAPLVLAGEIAYVGLLGSHPKFQAYVDAQAAKAERAQDSQASQQALAHILHKLPKDLLQRFQSLRAQCVELRRISLELKRPGMSADDVPPDQFQLTGLDRLLWIHLRLLYTQYALSQFLQKTPSNAIEQDIEKIQEQIAKLPAQQADPSSQRIRAALEDNLATSRDRLANLNKARDTYRLIQAEIDRLENKIRSLSEMAVNRQEPEFITSEVDHVASSLLDTERTMNELQFATGLNSVDNEPPELIRSQTVVGQK